MVVVTRIVSLVLALALSTGVSGEELLVEFTGTGNGLTEEFEVAGPWLLDWSITSEYESEAGIEIDLVEAVFLGHKGVVLKARYPGAGTKLFQDKGRLRFRVIANFASWRLRVSKITQEEADAMIPVRPGL